MDFSYNMRRIITMVMLLSDIVSSQPTTTTKFSPIQSWDTVKGENICAYCVQNTEQRRTSATLSQDDRAEIQLLKTKLVLLESNLQGLYHEINQQSVTIAKQNSAIQELTDVINNRTAGMTNIERQYNESMSSVGIQSDKLEILDTKIMGMLSAGNLSEKGPPGDAGPSGPPGQPGSKGPTGDKGVTGDQGQMGLIGRPGYTGDAGIPGAPGDTGETGTKGSRGDRGMPGRSGEVGAPGGPGEPGLRGAHGPPGEPGRPGWPGDKGQPGDPGTSGMPGAPGIPAECCADQNLVGPTACACVGDPGPQGESGPVGMPGQKGDTGEPGPVGPAGPPGTKGPPG